MILHTNLKNNYYYLVINGNIHTEFMSELLAPAGTLEAFYAAISNGADAIYLGLDKFSARAYANNFTLEKLEELVPFAHLRNVKIFVTLNTIIYDFELEETYKFVDRLAELHVDGIIVQDLALLFYITNNYKSIAAHCSTQMGIDDLDAATLAKELGCKRIVFARETPLLIMKDIKEKLQIEIEAFIHGALCVSYSGNCLMSSFLGDRSGNRGRCAGCCRKLYSLQNLDTQEISNTGYLLSMKDLNISSSINNMKFVDSLKIEGRMKEPTYVGGVVNTYRKLLDGEKIENDPLTKVFNRTYTRGFMNGEDSSNITNIEKPNNYGFYIGTIVQQNKNTIWIRLSAPLSKGDQIRIESENKFEELSVPVLKIFDASFNKVESISTVAIISCKYKVKVGAKVYKTKDNQFNNDVISSFSKPEYQKLPIRVQFFAKVGAPITLSFIYQNFSSKVNSDFNVEKSISSPTTKDNVVKQLSKLSETPYRIDEFEIDLGNDCFIPLKQLNELRRKGIEELNNARLNEKVIKISPTKLQPKNYKFDTPKIAVEVYNEEQYKIAKEEGIETIYYKNIIPRNNAKYKEINGHVLVGGLGGINHYRNKNFIISDYSLNIVNANSVALLSSLGVNRITLSQEIDKNSINNLVDSYKEKFNTDPNLELIVYGRNKLMHTKYCPLKRLGMCGQCKLHKFALKDQFESFPLLFNEDCTVNVLNSKILNNIDEIDSIKGVSVFRLVFTTENAIQVKEVITSIKKKLETKSNNKSFNNMINTRGHFYKNPL